MSERPTTRQAYLLCLGATAAKGNRRALRWVQISPHEWGVALDHGIVGSGPGFTPSGTELEQRETLCFTRWNRHAVPGQVYLADLDDGVVHGPGTYQGLWPDNLAVSAWRALSKAVDADLALRKQEKQDRQTDPLWELTLRQIVAVYVDLPAPARAQLLARVVHHISTGR